MNLLEKIKTVIYNLPNSYLSMVDDFYQEDDENFYIFCSEDKASDEDMNYIASVFAESDVIPDSVSLHIWYKWASEKD